jgi:putative nucleotidyltransferase with HDIG domain
MNEVWKTWEAACAEFPFLAATEGCPQEPLWHAEGDVKTHTLMVCAELEKLLADNEATDRERTILRLAALLHDVGKPATTRVEEDGKIHARGHGRVGAQIVREFWWRNKSLFDADIRRQVISLVRYHAKPLHNLDYLEDHVVATSVVANCRLVSLLAEADMRGRIGADLSSSMLKIDLFRACAQEMGCWSTPYEWTNEHSRWKFFQRGGRDWRYEAFDDRAFTVDFTIGIAASGKSTWSAARGLPVVNRDEIREEADLAPDKKYDQGVTTQLFQARLREHLRLKQPFVVDGTNLLLNLRSNQIDLCANYGARVVIHYFDVDRATALRRNRDRGETVRPDIIDRMGEKIEPPESSEAHAMEVHDCGDSATGRRAAGASLRHGNQ